MNDLARFFSGTGFLRVGLVGAVLAGAGTGGDSAWGKSASRSTASQCIPILGASTLTSMTGVVFFVTVTVEHRLDRKGLIVSFPGAPDSFSPRAQEAIVQGVTRAARSLELPTESWTVTVSHSYRGMTVHGDSLEAMLGLSVAALAQGYSVPEGLAMTGTITPDGRIGSVGALPHKLLAAGLADIRKVLVAEQHGHHDWQDGQGLLPHVLPVRSVRDAYALFTGQVARR